MLSLIFQVGFWTIRIEAQGQIEEKTVKCEKYYDPIFDVYVRMPSFVLNTDQVIKADIASYYPNDWLAHGDYHVRWYAKKVNISTHGMKVVALQHA